MGAARRAWHAAPTMPPIDADGLSIILAELDVAGDDAREELLKSLLVTAYPTLRTQNN
jgi:hypothetical protein